MSLHPPRRRHVRHTTSGIIEHRYVSHVCTRAKCPKALEPQPGVTCASCGQPLKELP